jgi:hypothetical protein
MTRAFRDVGLVVGLAAVAVAGLAAVALLLVDGRWFEGVLVVGLLGGVVMAVLIRSNARHRSARATPDPFARDVFSFDTMNIAHVRVAGVGGLCLILVAATVALQYQITTAAVGIGVIGGAVVGGALIVARRRR